MFAVNLTCIFLRHLDMALKQPLNVHIKTHSLWTANGTIIVNNITMFSSLRFKNIMYNQISKNGRGCDVTHTCNM